MPSAPIKLEVERLAAKMKAPFRISGYVFDAMPAVLATLSAGGVSGRGEAAGVYYLGDDQDHMVSQIESVRDAIESGATRAELQTFLPPGGARNALDCALWELEARRTAQPVWELAGTTKPTSRVTTFTLSADPLEVFPSRVDALPAAVKAIKLKLDGDIDADAERLRVVRKIFPNTWLMADANQGFRHAGFDRLESVLIEHRVALLEQPVPRGEEETLEGWRPPFPIAADESILSLSELDERVRFFDMVNIKLDKCGGLTEALAIAKTASAMGKSLMVGNMAGGTLAMAPAFIVAQLCQTVDLDGPFGLANDLHLNDIYRNGEIFIPEAIWGSA